MLELWQVGRAQGETRVQFVGRYADVKMALEAAWNHGPGKYRVTTAGGETKAKLTVPANLPLAAA